MVDGDGDEFTNTGEMLRKGSTKFVGLREIQHDYFLPDALRRQALLLDPAPEAGVACTAVFLLSAGDREWKKLRDREG
jgi:hypothetical protein